MKMERMKVRGRASYTGCSEGDNRAVLLQRDVLASRKNNASHRLTFRIIRDE